MLGYAKSILFKSNYIKRSIIRYKDNKEYRYWIDGGKKDCPPPHKYKELVIAEYAKRFDIDTFIETGTCGGDMVWAQRRNFANIFSVELSQYLHEIVSYELRRVKNIRLYQGDSSKMLPKMIDDAGSGKRILFWLDGHYSGDITAKGDKDTPIIEELNCILEKVKEFVILIDDARCFTGDGDYPTLDYLHNYIKSKRDIKWQVEHDIIRVVAAV